jgi:glutathione peroxidase
MGECDFTFEKIDSTEQIKLSDYRGKLILIVNTASACGFTKQYKDLEMLWQKYKDQGLVIIAIPSNDFGKQEKGSNKEIANFCKVNFDVSFVITKKLTVVGDESHEFFNATRNKFGYLSGPKWNFYKYLVGVDGELITWFSSVTSPSSKKIISAIEQNLPK